MNKTIKIISVLLVVFAILMIGSTVVMAAPGDIIKDINPDYQDPTNGQLTGIGKTIINIISTVAIIVAVIVLLIIGIKYMMGSASEKAEYKKTMIPYLIGAILVFGAGAIAQVIVNLASNIKV